MRINKDGEYMVEHHMKYKEIHGVDETVWMTQSEHQKLHARLRKEEKCDIPSKELRRISIAAAGRTEKIEKYQKEYQKGYAKTEKRKKSVREYQKGEKNKEYKREYYIKNKEKIDARNKKNYHQNKELVEILEQAI